MGHNHHHHDHSQSRSHLGHHHHHNLTDQSKVFWVLFLTGSFMFVEFIVGYLSNSLALMADAGHMLTDVAALGLALFAFRVSRKPATDRNTFGFYRMEILAAFINGVLLAVIALGILISAIERLQAPPDVHAENVIVVALIGLGINLISGYILSRGDQSNLNMKGALFHVMGDALSSVGTLIASLLILWLGWVWADPVVSAIIALIIVFSAYRLISDTVHVILQGVPREVNVPRIRDSLIALEGVQEIHNLHVWSLSSNMIILTVHIVEKEVQVPRLLERAKLMLEQQYNIKHSTIQIERESLKQREPSF